MNNGIICVYVIGFILLVLGFISLLTGSILLGGENNNEFNFDTPLYIFFISFGIMIMIIGSVFIVIAFIQSRRLRLYGRTTNVHVQYNYSQSAGYASYPQPMSNASYPIPGANTNYPQPGAYPTTTNWTPNFQTNYGYAGSQPVLNQENAPPPYQSAAYPPAPDNEK